MFLCISPIVPASNEFAECFERARLSQGFKYDDLARLCGITRTRLMQCVGSGDFSMRKIWALLQCDDGRRFVEALFCEISLAKGLREWDGVIRALLVVTDAVTRGREMAKAVLCIDHDERRSA